MNELINMFSRIRRQLREDRGCDPAGVVGPAMAALVARDASGVDLRRVVAHDPSLQRPPAHNDVSMALID
jgi:hypothetical protein